MRLFPAIAAFAMLGVGLDAADRAQSQPPFQDPIEALQAAMDEGHTRLAAGDGPWPYLTSLLGALQIEPGSQVLVFSKTSFQFDKIGPKTPRALYFNDDTAVGVVQDGRVVEIITTGSDGQIAYYSLSTVPQAKPKFVREDINCQVCHQPFESISSNWIVADVTPKDDGSTVIRNPGTLFEITDSTTPFEKRWGGWYVTGSHGSLRHNGNVRATQADTAKLDPIAGQNVTDLSSRFDVSPYLQKSSDIVALMTLEHQLGVMNRIWLLEARASELSSGKETTTPGDINKSIEDLVIYMVGAKEAPMPSPVTGISNFTSGFAARAPRDEAGRSLREFDLKTRLFRYPLSYMIYSRAFAGLDSGLRLRIYRRLYDVLSGADTSAIFSKLDPAARRAAIEIVRATKPDIPAFWRAAG